MLERLPDTLRLPMCVGCAHLLDAAHIAQNQMPNHWLLRATL